MCEPPCGLPAEIWKEEILERHLHIHFAHNKDGGLFFVVDEAFLYIRSLRLTCKWFAQHCRIVAWSYGYQTKTAFWPAVEEFIKLGYRDFLFKLDWPTHRGCCIQRGYDGPNWSFGRAGNAAAKQGDVDLVRLLMIHGQEWWTHWLAKAIKHQRRAVIALLLPEIESGIKIRGICDDYIFGHEPLLNLAIEAHDFETLKVLTRYIQVKPAHFQLSVECKAPSIMQWHLRARLDPSLRIQNIRQFTVRWKWPPEWC
jgi:hypothetical protein